MTPGTNAGTGRPLWFRCSQCRLHRRRGQGGTHRVTLTGRKRRAPVGNAGLRNSQHVRQYRCLDCGHVGWSRHVDLETIE